VAEVLAWAYELDGKVIPKPENIADRKI
ncbi:MAG: hypothetical protein RIQ35_1471, partial [Pseudomonadota bacterium]